MPGQCVFNDTWRENSLYSEWLERDLSDRHKARCCVCVKTFGLGSMGEAAVRSHMKGTKHHTLMGRRKNLRTPAVREFLVTHETGSAHSTGEETAPDSASSADGMTAAGEKSSGFAKSKSGTIASFVSREETLRAEIIWTLHCVRRHYSFKSNEEINKIFQAMFPDSETAKRFTCGEKKTAYMCNFGLAPHFKLLLDKLVNEQRSFVLCFDESMNEVTKNKQLDVHVRFWDEVGKKVVSRYYGSEFMGHAESETLLKKFLDNVERINLANLLQVSMDGPNVNIKFLRLLEEKVSQDSNSKFLNIGSCGLHVVHGAFKTGFENEKTGVHHFLQSLHMLFNDTPARREDFTKVTGSDVFPLRFCKHRWLENTIVTERALQILENMKKYVSAVLNGKLKDPKTKSYETVRDWCRDPLVETKLNIFLSVSKILNPFLTLYQADRPLLPFITDDLMVIFRSLLHRFVKPEVLRDNDAAVKLVNLDVSDKKLYCESKKIDLGFTAENAVAKLLSDKKISERQILELRMELRQGLVKVVQKLQEKSPVSYGFVRNLRCLNPKLMESDKETSIIRLKRILKALVDARKIAEEKCDSVLTEYREFVHVTIPLSAAKYAEFDHKNEQNRVDMFLYEAMCSTSTDLWDVVKMVLLMSHGQATVERGFSVNKEIALENLQESTFTSLRFINDHIDSVGGVLNVKISKSLVLSAGAARQKYMAYLDERKREHEKQIERQKRKSIMDNLDELRHKKRRLESDISSLSRSSETFADKAESTGQVTWIAKSNSLRRSAKEKTTELAALTAQIEDIAKSLAS